MASYMGGGPQSSKRLVTKSITYQESAVHCGYRCNTDRLLDELKDEVERLRDILQPTQNVQAITRRTAVIKARQTIIQRVGRSINNMTWNEYHDSLTTQERDASGVESPEVWRKLASSKRGDNKAAHVADKAEVALAICAAQEGKASWYSIFYLAYGEDPESLTCDT